MRSPIAILILFTTVLITSINLQAGDPIPLKDIQTFMYQIQGLEKRGSLDRLAESPYDMLIVDDIGSARGAESIDPKTILAKLRKPRPNRLILAYFDIGAAESDRTYWQRNWKPPTARGPGSPDFLLALNSKGWEDTYPVAYWDPRWHETLITAKESVLKKILATGYDGVVLDWVAACNEPKVAAAAKAKGIDPAKEMTRLIRSIKDEFRKTNPRFLLVAQNAPFLIDRDPEFADSIDAVLFEATWFNGKGDVSWNSSDGGDIPTTLLDGVSLADQLQRFDRYKTLRKPVFTVDYCLKPENAQKAYHESASHGYIPLITRSSLGALTTTPPK